MVTTRWMSGHWCTPPKGAHGRGAVWWSPGLGDGGSGLLCGRRHCWVRARRQWEPRLCNGRAQGKGYMRKVAGAEAGHGKGVDGVEA